jgi:hypothetical protein
MTQPKAGDPDRTDPAKPPTPSITIPANVLDAAEQTGNQVDPADGQTVGQVKDALPTP